MKELKPIWACTVSVGRKAAIFCQHAAVCVPNTLWNFYLVKNHKIVTNPTATDAREKISAYLESLELKKIFMRVSLNLKKSNII